MIFKKYEEKMETIDQNQLAYMMLEEFLRDDVTQLQNPDEYLSSYAANGRFYEYPITNRELQDGCRFPSKEFEY